MADEPAEEDLEVFPEGAQLGVVPQRLAFEEPGEEGLREVLRIFVGLRPGRADVGIDGLPIAAGKVLRRGAIRGAAPVPQLGQEPGRGLGKLGEAAPQRRDGVVHFSPETPGETGTRSMEAPLRP